MRIRAVASLAFVAALAALAAGCGAGDQDVRPAGTASPVVRVTCAEAGTRVATPVVEAQRDGVHLELRNETDGEAHVTIERGSSGGSGAGGPPGVSSHVLTIGPGIWTATCYESVDTVRGATFEVADTGLWVSTDVDDCESPSSTHGDPPARVADDESELPEQARSMLEASVGFEPGYEIEPAGYPDERGRIFRARVDGKTVATASFYPDDSGGWVTGSVTYCEELGPGSSEVGEG
jgi:hypothetical protein